MATVQIKVKSDLKSILGELESIKLKAGDLQKAFEDTTNETSKNLKRRTKDTETFFGNLRGYARRMADEIKSDFKSLISAQSLAAGLKLSDQFKNSVTETVALSDAIRKLGPIFGIASRDFVSFQKDLTKGLGEIGLSSEVAAKTLEGLSTTQVRGPQNLTAYSRAAGQLASIGREQGREGEIAGGMARVIQARGGNVNDQQQMKDLAESLRRIFLTTGLSPTKALSQMEALFAKMPQDFRKMFNSGSLANLTTAGAVGGPNATKFLEEYLGESPIARTAFEAQGGGNIFGKNGLDIEKFRAFSKDILGRIGMDPRASVKTLGLSEDAAEGFIRLSESLDRVRDAQEKLKNQTGDLGETYRSSMGLGESFRANINRIKSFLAEPIGFATQKLTEGLGEMSKTDMGAGAVVAGGGLLAALLTGRGLKGILGTVAKGAAAEQITGQKVQPVYVTNADEISGGLGGMAAAGGMGFLGKAGLVGAAGLAGVGIGSIIEPTVSKFLEENTTDTTKEGFRGDILERLFFKLDMLLGGDTTAGYRMNPPDQRFRFDVNLNTPLLKVSKPPMRGTHN